MWRVEDERKAMEEFKNWPVRIAAGAALVLLGAGGAYALTGTAAAQDETTTTVAPEESTPDAVAPDTPMPPPDHADRDPSKGGHTAGGITEELLTGDQAAQAEAAALEAVPGGTIERVETDAEGDAYEAHMVDADGVHVTVKFDENFTVTSLDEGP